MATIPWKPLSQLPTGKFLNPPKAAKYKVFFAGGEYPPGMDYFQEAHCDRTHWCYRNEIPGPCCTKARKKAPAKKKAVKKAAKKVAKKAKSRYSVR